MAERERVKGTSYGFAQSIAERRGHAPIPSDRTKKYSVKAYRALYGIPEILAERFCEQSRSHYEVEQLIHRHFTEHPDMRSAALTEYDGPGVAAPSEQEAERLMEKLKKTSWSEVGKEF